MITKGQIREMLQCKAFTHSWNAKSMPSKKKAGFGRRVELDCDRCQSERVLLLNIYGEIGASWYELSDAYVDSGISKMSKREAKAKLAFNGQAASAKTIKARQLKEKIVDSTR
jgi:hypothetical protein